MHNSYKELVSEGMMEIESRFVQAIEAKGEPFESTSPALRLTNTPAPQFSNSLDHIEHAIKICWVYYEQSFRKRA